MVEEYKAFFFRNDTWKIVSLTSTRKVIGCKWIFCLKLKPNGEIERYKAWLVAQGFNQDYGIDHFKTFSSVVKPTTIGIVLTIVISKN